MFPDGINPPGPGPDPEDSECLKPFPGLSPYKTSTETALDTGLGTPAAVAVVPQGMSFSFVREDTSGTATAEAGDLFVADLDSDKIYFYDQSKGNARATFPAEAQELGGGVALYLEEVEVSGTQEKVQLLLYTGINKTTGKSNLFLYDLDPAPLLTTPNPFKIPDDTQGLLPGVTDFNDAQAVAVGRDGTQRGVFVSDPGAQANDYSVYRISMTISGTTPAPDSMFTLATDFNWIRDVAFSNDTKALYLTENDSSLINDATVYKIDSAIPATATVKKSDLTVFIPASQLKTSTGLTLAPTSQDGTTEDLLVLSQEVSRALGQFDAAQGGFAQDYLSIFYEKYQDVAYDCTHERILFTRDEFSPGLYEFSR